jgi:hypothetical protein
MQSLTLHAHVGKDGILKLETPIGIANTDLEIILIVNPVAETRPATKWPSDFFTEIIGGWEGKPLVREPQGTYEARNEFK